jgi:transcriptional activator of cad operon
MDRPTAIPLRIGDWRIDPTAGQISRNGETVRLDARTMRLLLCLAEHAGETVSIDQLLDRVWAGVVVTPDSVYQAVASLRRLLGDDPKMPRYIATVPRLGYRMVAPVNAWDDQLSAPTADTTSASMASTASTAPTAPTGPTAIPTASTAAAPAAAAAAQPAADADALARAARSGYHRTIAVTLGALAVCGMLLSSLVLRHGPTGALAANDAAISPRSVAVLPFLDLTTQEMNEEYFADGMTEELIDKLSKISTLRVPAPTDSFYFKGKQLPVADIARSLRVAYVLDGSIRKSGEMLRIAARLVHADDGFVVWSGTYDRPYGDKIAVQDEIAGEVAKALRASIP